MIMTLIIMMMIILMILLISIYEIKSYHQYIKRNSLKTLYARAIIKGFNNDGKNLFNNNNNNMILYLNDSISSLVDLSRNKYFTGALKNPKPQMGSWMDDQDRSLTLQLLEDTIIASESILAKFIMECPTPLIIDIIPSNSTNSLYSITFFHMPPYGIMPSRQHIAGTILFYKALYGSGTLKASIKDRIIAEDQFKGSYKNSISLTNNDESIPKGTILTRIGGPTRTFEYQSTAIDLVDSTPTPSGYLEICLFPPEGSTDNIIDQLVQSEDNHITRLDPPNDQLLSLFNSHKQRQSKLEKNSSNTKNIDLAIEDKSRKYGDVKKKLTKKIGGLDEEINEIVRRLLASRRLPPTILQSLGLQHVRGMLLWGPPGTGKTLIAREIAKALNSREPKIVNGPEILDKFVGEAEKNIRELFREADEEWDRLGFNSELHVIILDEIDAIAKKRGFIVGDGSGVRDSVVNQLLTKIDGVKERNNVLIIGLTNRIDLLDPAIIRPGRLEVHVRVKEPTRSGREEILYIMMKPMILGNFLSINDAKLFAERISFITAGYTGADLAGLLRSACSFAVNRFHNEDTKIEIKWIDIEEAIKEMRNTKRISKRKIIYETISHQFQRVFKPMKINYTRKLEDILYDN